MAAAVVETLTIIIFGFMIKGFVVCCFVDFFFIFFFCRFVRHSQQTIITGCMCTRTIHVQCIFRGGIDRKRRSQKKALFGFYSCKRNLNKNERTSKKIARIRKIFLRKKISFVICCQVMRKLVMIESSSHNK